MLRAGRSIVLAVGLAFGAFAAPNASATTLAELTVEQMTDASTYIVRGTVGEVWTSVDERGFVWTHAELAVTDVFKGPDTPKVLVVETPGGITPDGQVTQVHAAARFSTGEDVLVFLDSIRGGTSLTPVSMFLGKYNVRRAPGEDASYLMRWHGKPLEKYDGRFLPHPEPASRIGLDQLIGQVEARLQVGWDGAPIPGIAPEKLQVVNAPERRIR
jgi:hypothetical protein